MGVAVLRQASPNGLWLTQLQNMVQFMAQNGLGYRNIAGAWNTPQNTPAAGCTPDAWFYDPVAEQIVLQWYQASLPSGTALLKNGQWPLQASGDGLAPYFPTSTVAPAVNLSPQAPPGWPQQGATCRLQVRKWKDFQVLNGRWSASSELPYSATTAPNPYTTKVGPFQFAIRILRKCRQPQTGTVPKVSPIAWNIWYPAEYIITPPPSTPLPVAP